MTIDSFLDETVMRMQYCEELHVANFALIFEF